MALSGFRARIPGLLGAVLSVVGLMLALAGGPMLVLWLGALVSLGSLVSRWISAGLSIAVVTIAFLTVELLVLRLSPLVPLGLTGLGLVVWMAIGVGCGVASAILPPALRDWRGRNGALAAAALSGVAMTVAWAIVDVADPSAVHLAWAMFDDAVRDLLSSRSMVADNGISSSSLGQTPLPFGVVASNMAPGRGALTAGELLRHDVSRMAQVWMAAAAATCLLLGSAVARAVRGIRLVYAIPLTAGASLFGLSWWVLGISLYGGFINATFAIIVMVACWLVYVEGERRPFLTALVLLAGCVTMLSVWPPLLLCLIGLAAVSVVRAFLRRATLAVTAVLAVACALVVLYAAAFSLPSAVVASSALGNEGGFPEILSPIIFGFVALFDVYLIVGAIRLRQRYIPIGTAVVILGSIAGLVYLLYQRRGKADAWGYYPEKFTWLVLLMLVPITIGLLVFLVSSRPPTSAAQRVTLTALVIGGTLAALIASGISSSERVSPLIGIAQGRVFGISNTESNAVFDYTNEIENLPTAGFKSERKQWEYIFVDPLFHFVAP